MAFYENCAARGGLVRSPEPPVGRAVPGFRAESADYDFSLDLYRHHDLTFWTIQLADKTVRPRNRIPLLRLLDRNDERAILQDPDTGEEYIAPASALTEHDPLESIKRYSEPKEREVILWSSLPEWIQFGFGDGEQGEIHRRCSENGEEEWDASISLNVEDDDHREVFETCLNSLDAYRFDPSGVERPERSYLVLVLQWGHSLNTRIRSEGGDSGSLVALNTLGNLSVFARYSPPRK